MALTEDEEFELLSLEREKSQIPKPSQPGMMDQIGSAFRSATNQAVNTPMGQIAGMQETINEGFNRLGSRTAESFAQNGLNAAPLFSPSRPLQVSPGMAAGLGTAVAMTPDIVAMAASPIDTSKTAVEAAVPAARRALGFQKSFLRTPFARGQATKAAGTALEEGIIPASGNPQTMFDRANNLAQKSGKPIQETLKNVPADFDSALGNLESLRGSLTKGLKEGVSVKTNSAIDEVRDSLSEMARQGEPDVASGIRPIFKKNASSINQLKNRIGKSLNYLSDLASQGDNKAIQTNLANTVRDMVKKVVPPEEFVTYLKNQKLYNAAKLMEKGLNNELAAQAGNQAVSLPSMIMGSGRVAAGDIPGAIATLGLTEGLKRRGMGMAANEIQKAGKLAPGIGIASSVQAGKILQPKKLTDQKAAEYIDKAEKDPEVVNGTKTAKEKALEMLRADGY